jgi:hypothetical protein
LNTGTAVGVGFGIMGMLISLPFIIIGTLIYAWLHKIGFKSILKIDKDKIPGLFKRFTICLIASAISVAGAFYIFSLLISHFVLALSLFVILLAVLFVAISVLITKFWCSISYQDATKSLGFVFVLLLATYVMPGVFVMYKMGSAASSMESAMQGQSEATDVAQASLLEQAQEIQTIQNIAADQNQAQVAVQAETAQQVEPTPTQAQVPVPVPALPINISPSFDCTKASSTSERLICSHSELAAADIKLMQVYKEATLRSVDKDALKKSQNAWRKIKRDSCSDAKCVQDAYESRITELNAA